MKYIVNVKEISYGTIEVNADSKEEAQDLAVFNYHKGFTNWMSGEYELEVTEAPKEREDAR